MWTVSSQNLQLLSDQAYALLLQQLNADNMKLSRSHVLELVRAARLVSLA
jgi:hypothetical protein